MKILFFQFMRKKLNVASDEFVEKYRRYKLKMFLSEMARVLNTTMQVIWNTERILIKKGLLK